MTNDKMVPNLRKFKSLEKVAPVHLECAQKTKSQCLKTSLNARDDFLESLLENLDKVSTDTNSIKLVDSESKYFLLNLDDHRST